MKPTVKCPECYNAELYKNGKDKKDNQKYLCKKCRIQFTLQSIKQLTPSTIDDPSSENLFGKDIFS